MLTRSIQKSPRSTNLHSKCKSYFLAGSQSDQALIGNLDSSNFSQPRTPVDQDSQTICVFVQVLGRDGDGADLVLRLGCCYREPSPELHGHNKLVPHGSVEPRWWVLQRHYCFWLTEKDLSTESAGAERKILHAITWRHGRCSGPSGYECFQHDNCFLIK